MTTIEYRVRPVTRYIVTRYTSDGTAAGVEELGEFQNERLAADVMEAFTMRGLTRDAALEEAAALCDERAADAGYIEPETEARDCAADIRARKTPRAAPSSALLRLREGS